MEKQQPLLPHLHEDVSPSSPRVSPFSTALLVKNPAGAMVCLESVLTPHPENRSVDVVNVKDGTAVLCAHLSERLPDAGDRAGEGAVATVLVTTKSQGIPIAIMDTSGAIYP